MNPQLARSHDDVPLCYNGLKNIKKGLTSFLSLTKGYTTTMRHISVKTYERMCAGKLGGCQIFAARAQPRYRNDLVHFE